MGEKIACTICGARLELTALEPEPAARRYAREPAEEIRDRVETFARLRGYALSEEKESLLEGLVEKNRRFGDFYCPCRFAHEPGFVCPCLETRQNYVRKEGGCY